MQKKIFTSLLALCSFLSLGSVLASCGQDKTSSASESSAPASSVAPTSSVAPASSVVEESSQTPAASSSVEEFADEGKYQKKGDLITRSSQYASQYADLTKTDWSAYWIWTQKCEQKDSYVAFRKTFTLNEAPKGEVKAYIGVDSKYFLWINGEMAVLDGGLKRGLTGDSTFFDVVDISSYLKKGDNVIAALAVYNGKSGYSSSDSGRGGFLFEADIDGTKITSDNSFKCINVEAYGSVTQQRSMASLAEFSVEYDGQKDMGDWHAFSFDDSSWASASRIAKPNEGLFGTLYQRLTPMTYFDHQYTDFVNSSDYVGKKFDTETTISLKLPADLHISFSFDCTAETAGGKITFNADANEAMVATSFIDSYIVKAGENTYENYPWRAENALSVTVPAGVTFSRLQYRLSGYDEETAYATTKTTAGTFASGDDQLDLLWKKSLNSLTVNMRDSYMDCPDRERGGYVGDAVNEMSMSYYALDTTSAQLNKKMYLTAMGWIGDDNVMPTNAPGKYVVTQNELPDQSLAFTASIYDYYLYTGDQETLGKFYDAAVNYLKVWNLQSDGLIEFRAGNWDWADWGSEKNQNALLQNIWYYICLKNLKASADVLGLTKDNDFFSTRMSSIETGITSFRGEDHLYKSENCYGGVANNRENAMMIVSGLAKEEDYDAIAAQLADAEQYSASPYMEKYCEEALCMLGKYDDAKTRMLARYSMNLTDTKYDTLYELFDNASGSNSIHHGWSGGSLYVMGKYFAGIRPLTAGYQTFEIQPTQLFTSASVETSSGKITIERNDSSIKVNTPSGLTGTLKLDKTLFNVSNADSSDENFFYFNLTGGEKTIALQ